MNYWRYPVRCFLVITGLACGSAALAWSSKSYPLFEPVHQIAIENVLSNQVTSAEIQILKDQQAVVDQDQKAFQSYEHSMTGLMKPGDTTNNQTINFIALSEQFVRTNLMAAVEARKTGADLVAFTNLGKALHALEDATSPAHEPFQPWSYNESWWNMAVHVSKERVYPNDESDTNQIAEKTKLEGVVQFAFDIYTGTSNMPARFYNPTNGFLELPSVYLHARSK